MKEGRVRSNRPRVGRGRHQSEGPAEPPGQVYWSFGP